MRVRGKRTKRWFLLTRIRRLTHGELRRIDTEGNVITPTRATKNDLMTPYDDRFWWHGIDVIATAYAALESID
jgi:hypothetical protein